MRYNIYTSLRAKRSNPIRDCFVTLFLAMTIFFSSTSYAETIFYTIHQIGFDGQASLRLVGPTRFKGQDTVLIVFKARGDNYWDEEDIYVDPKTYKPLFVERNYSLKAFGQAKTEEEYLPAKNEIVITKTEGQKSSQEILKKNGEVDNIYGFVLRYRKQGSFQTGDELNMSLPTKDLKIRLVGQKPLKIDGKTYDTYYMESQPTRYKIWFDTVHKLPLRITGTLGIVNSVMTMTDYEEKSDKEISIP
jgi:hypothetical protein